MELISCHVFNFGKLQELDIDFREGISVILHENGWGKSSLAAFLRAMLYGFEGDSKKKLTENERKFYKPWQGGTYGGNLTFRACGMVYTVTRIFGSKKSEDRFELRDAATNKITDVYSENLGEELFGIDRATFERTVFVAQKDVVTYPTNRMHAKMGFSSFDAADLGKYQMAHDALNTYLNRMSPRRATGRIARERAELTRLKTEALRLPIVASQVESLAGKLKDAELRKGALQEELRHLSGLQKRAAADSKVQANEKMYAKLCQEEAEEQDRFLRTLRVFPGGSDKLPSAEDL